MLYLGNTKVAPILERPSIIREVDSNGVFQAPQSETHVVLPKNATKLGEQALYYAYYNATGLKSFNANNLAEIEHLKNNAMAYAFGYSGIESLEFPELTTISAVASMARMCIHCTSLMTVSFPKLSVINWEQSQFTYAFSYCTSLASISFPSLVQMDIGNVFYYAFDHCTSLRNVYFNALKSTSFGSIKTQFSSMLNSCNNCTVHFPSNLQSVISSWATASNMKGSNTVIAFDLAATE